MPDQTTKAVHPVSFKMPAGLMISEARCRTRLAAMPAGAECPGHGRGGTAPRCCARAGEYKWFGSDGPTSFSCPKGCACHD